MDAPLFRVVHTVSATATVNFNGLTNQRVVKLFHSQVEVNVTSMESLKKESLFHSLPDELVLKIVKMASKPEHSYACWATRDHTFIVGTISRISAR